MFGSVYVKPKLANQKVVYEKKIKLQGIGK